MVSKSDVRTIHGPDLTIRDQDRLRTDDLHAELVALMFVFIDRTTGVPRESQSRLVPARWPAPQMHRGPLGCQSLDASRTHDDDPPAPLLIIELELDKMQSLRDRLVKPLVVRSAYRTSGARPRRGWRKAGERH